MRDENRDVDSIGLRKRRDLFEKFMVTSGTAEFVEEHFVFTGAPSGAVGFDLALPIKDAAGGDCTAVKIVFKGYSGEGKVAAETCPHDCDTFVVDQASGQNGLGCVGHIIVHPKKIELTVATDCRGIAGRATIVWLKHGIAAAGEKLYLWIEVWRVALP